MHGKGSLAVMLLVAALAVPPAMYYGVWNPGGVRETQEAPQRATPPAPPVVTRPEPVALTPPPPIKAPPSKEIPGFVVIARDPMLSPADIERLKPKPPEPTPAPVAPPPAPRPRPERLGVEGIIAIDGQERKAIINGRETAVGERVGRSRVIGIDLDGVRFQSRGRIFKKKVGD